MSRATDKWSRQGVDIDEACAHPDYPEDDPDKFREDCETEREYLQEYKRVFHDAEGNYFNRHEIDKLDPLPDHYERAEVSSYVGVDIGRKNDLTAIVATKEWHYDGSDYIWPSHLFLLDQVKFKHQKSIIKLLIEAHNPLGACLDETAHPDTCEEVVDYFLLDDTAEFDGDAVKGLQGDRARKKEHTQRVQGRIEDEAFVVEPITVREWVGECFVDVDRNVLVDHLCQVEEGTTAGGDITYQAPRGDDGHADAYSALLLALAAKDETASSYIGSF